MSTAPSGHEIVQQLVALRVKQRRTQADVAEAIGVCRATVGRFETDPTRCRRSPSLHILQRYANAVGAQITIKEQDA